MLGWRECKILGKRRVCSQPWGGSNNPHLSVPPAPILAAQHKGPGVMSGPPGTSVQGLSLGGSLPWTVVTLMWWSRAAARCRGRRQDRAWGPLIRRNMGQSASWEPWLLGMSVLNWESKGAQNGEASIKQQHLPPSAQADLHRAGGKQDFSIGPSVVPDFWSGAHRWVVLSLVRTTLAPPR